MISFAYYTIGDKEANLYVNLKRANKVSLNEVNEADSDEEAYFHNAIVAEFN